MNDPPGRFKTKESEVEFYLTQGGQVRLRRACSRVLKILAFGPSAGLVWAAFYQSPWLRFSPNWLQYSSLYDVAYSALTFGKVILGNSSIFFAGSITALVSWLFVYVWSEDIRRKADELDTRVHWARREISAAEQTHALIRSSNIAAGPQIYYQNLPVDIWGVIASCLRRDTLVRLALVSRAYRPFILSKVDGITSADLKYWGSTDEQNTVSFLHSVAPLAQTRFGSQLRRVEIPAAKYYLTCEAIQLVAALPFLEELAIGEPQAEMSDSSVNVYRRMRLKMSMHVMETFQQCEFAALRSLDISRVTLDESVNCSQYISRLTGLTYLAMIKLDLHVLQTLRNLRGLHVLEIDFGFSRGSFDEMPKLQDLEIIRHSSPELVNAVPNLTRLVYSDAQHAVVPVEIMSKLTSLCDLQWTYSEPASSDALQSLSTVLTRLTTLRVRKLSPSLASRFPLLSTWEIPETNDFAPILARGNFLHLKSITLSLTESFQAFLRALAENPMTLPSLESITVLTSLPAWAPDIPHPLLLWLEARAAFNVAPLREFKGGLNLDTLKRLHTIYGTTLTSLSVIQNVERTSPDWLFDIVKFENLRYLYLPSISIRGALLSRLIPTLKHLNHLDISVHSKMASPMPEDVAAVIRRMPSLQVFKY